MDNSNKYVIEDGILKSEELTFESENFELGKLFLDTLRCKPKFLGQVDGITGHETTYEEMFDKSVRCALWLRKQGLNPGETILICSFNQMSVYVPILATFYNGAANVYSYRAIDLDMTRNILSLLKPKFLFIQADEIEVFEEAAKKENLHVKIITFTKVPGFYYLNDILNEAEMKEVHEFQCLQPLTPNDDCIFSFTSGSTSISKIVPYSYKSTLETLLFYKSNNQESQVSLVYLPLFWLNAFRDMLVEIINFTTRIIVSEVSYDLHEAFQLIEKYKVTKVRFSLGMVYRMHKWKKLEFYDTSSIRILSFGGVKLPPEMIIFLMQVAKNGYVEQTYGSTEITIPMCKGIMNNIDLTSSGHLNKNMSMKVIDIQTGETLGPKESGEICFKSPFLMKGYYKNQEATDKAIDPEGWYHSGDLGYYDESGLGYIFGRVNNTLKLPNGKIAPLWKVERALFLITEVIDAVVLSASEISDSPRIFGFVMLLPGTKISEEEFSEIAKDMSGIEVPITVKILNELPRTPNGKFHLFKLRNLIKELL